MTHGRPTIEELAALASGELATGQADAIEAAAASDPELRVALRRLRGTIALLRSDDGCTPPSESVARTKALLARLSHGTAPAVSADAGLRWWEALRQVAGRLVFDSAQPGHALGFRDAGALAGGESTGTRHLAFEGQGVEVDLQFEAGTFDGHPSRCQIIGQVTRTAGDLEERAGLPVAMVSSAGAVIETVTDAMGVFSLCVERGRHDLFIGGSDPLTVSSLQVP